MSTLRINPMTEELEVQVPGQGWAKAMMPVNEAGSVINQAGKTMKRATGIVNAANQSLVAAVGGKKIKVYSISLTTASTSLLTITFTDGTGGTVVGTYYLQAGAGTVAGIVDAETPPGTIMETSVATALFMTISPAGQNVAYNVRYFDDDAA